VSSSSLTLSASFASASFAAALLLIIGLGARFTLVSASATFARKPATSACVFLCCCNKAAYSGASGAGCMAGSGALVTGAGIGEEVGGLAAGVWMGVIAGVAAGEIGT